MTGKHHPVWLLILLGLLLSPVACSDDDDDDDDTSPTTTNDDDDITSNDDDDDDDDTTDESDCLLTEADCPEGAGIINAEDVTCRCAWVEQCEIAEDDCTPGEQALIYEDALANTEYSNGEDACECCPVLPPNWVDLAEGPEPPEWDPDLCPINPDTCGEFSRLVAPDQADCRCCPFYPAEYNHYTECPLEASDCPEGMHLMNASSPSCYCMHNCFHSGDCPEETADTNDPQWPGFGHDWRNTRTNPVETKIGPENVHKLERKWQHVGPSVTSTPAVYDGKVYFGDWAGDFYALDAEEGSVVWKVNLGGGIHPSPLVTEEVIYIPQSRWLHALDRSDGSVIWRVDIGDHSTNGADSSPMLFEDTILMGVNCGEIGRNCADPNLDPPCTCRGSIAAFDKADGALKWRFHVTNDDECSGAGVSVWSTAAIDAKRRVMYIGTGNTYEFPASPWSDGIVALKIDTGEVHWVRQFTIDDVYTIIGKPPQGPDADVGAAPNLFTVDGRDLVGAGDKNGVYTVLDRDTGEAIWSRPLTPGSHLGGVMQAASYHDGVIYVGANLWPNGIDTTIVWIPDFSNFCNITRVFALDAGTGETLWETDVQYVTIGGMLQANGVVYIGTTLGWVYALDAATGEILWNDKAGETLASGRSLVDGRMYVSTGFSFIGIVSDAPDSEAGGVICYGLPEE